MKVGDKVRIGAPYAYAFGGESSIQADVLNVDDEILTVRTEAGSVLHANLRLILFVEILLRGDEKDEHDKGPAKSKTA